jgi:ribosome-binding factor A
MKNRLARVRELLKRELGSIILRDLKFTSPLVTVSGVDITPDLKNAHVFISALGVPHERSEAIEVLEKNRTLLQSELSKRVVIKNTPHLHFHLDESIERGTRVITLMNELGLDPLPPEEEDEEDERND